MKGHAGSNSEADGATRAAGSTRPVRAARGAHEPTTAAIDVRGRIVEAQEAERSRLAREIHDGPAQALSNAILQLGIVEKLMARDPVLAGAELRLLQDILRRELAEMRSYISELRPPVLTDLGLSRSIVDAAHHVGGILGISIDVDIEPAIGRVPPGSDLVVLRVVQEALQNVRKHAQANRVWIRARMQDDEVIIEIQDDGRGFNPETSGAVDRRTFGVQFMRERAESIGARFEVRSRLDDGTLVRLVIHGGAEETT